MTSKLSRYTLIGIACLGVLLRLIKLDWGEGNFFHPDERNIAASVSQLSFPLQMNPHFYAYGSFPIYLYFLITKLILIVKQPPFDTFTISIMVGRMISAILSGLIIWQAYRLGKRFGKLSAVITVLLTIFSVGLIQYAHFSTVEILQAFLYLLIFEFIFKYWEQKKMRWWLLASIILGISMATKVTSVLILPIFLLAILFSLSRKGWIKTGLLLGFVLMFVSLCVFVITFPYFILGFSDFKGAMNYEGGVATGKSLVFYTKQYEGSLPIMWHFQKVLPWILGFGATAILPLVWLGVPANWIVNIKKLTIEHKGMILIWIFVTLFFGWHTVLYVKWVRYLIPIVPLINIMTGYFLAGMLERGKISRSVGMAIFVLVLGGSIWQSLNFAKIYLQSDTRIAAGIWAGENIGPDDRILTEIYDMGVTSMPEYTMKNTKLYNFYDLDVDNQEERIQELTNDLEKSDWILVPSRRIYGFALEKGNNKLTGNYYKLLFSGKLGFEKKVDFYIQTFLDERAEETYQVFDHPRVMLFKKVTPYSAVEYKNKIEEGI